MKLSITESAKLDTIITFIFENSNNKPQDFEGKNSKITIRYDKKKTIIYCGLGDKKGCNNDILRASAANAIKKVISLKRTKVSITFPKVTKKSIELKSIVEGAILGTYSFQKYKSEKNTEVKSIEFVSDTLTKTDITQAQKLCLGIFFARDLINENAHIITPEKLANEACIIAKSSSLIKCEILTEKDIEKKGMGLIQAVGMGSPFPPRVALLEYIGAPKSKDKIAIVGKGITFDSGGQNLKPSGHIETMRCDMSGAAAVLGTMKVLAALKPKVNVVGVITTAHNAIDGTSYFPGDIYKSYSGKTVEILNTDAEGRLVLADAISYCQDKYKPTELIDLATLTGAIIYSLGDLAAGLFSNNDSLAMNLYKAGEVSGENLWRMPIRKPHSDSMKSDFADLRNISKLPKGHSGSSTAAAFLMEFIKDIPWAHIDIAGTAFNDRESRGELPKYATGFGVRLLMAYLEGKKV